MMLDSYEEAYNLLANGLDRDKDSKDTLCGLVKVALNGIYWRDEEIKQKDAYIKGLKEHSAKLDKEYVKTFEELQKRSNELEDLYGYNLKLNNRIAELEKENILLQAKVSWLNNIYAGLLCSHKHLAPIYPGDDEVLEDYKSKLEEKSE